jgi:acyl carrier protein
MVARRHAMPDRGALLMPDGCQMSPQTDAQTDAQTAAQTAAEHDLAQLMVESLNLEGVEPAQIDPEAPLFNAGLGLDSIDALELALAVSKRYGFQLRSDNDENRRIFASLRALSAHVEQHKAA